jgi:hypothetical protein
LRRISVLLIQLWNLVASVVCNAVMKTASCILIHLLMRN